MRKLYEKMICEDAKLKRYEDAKMLRTEVRMKKYENQKRRTYKNVYLDVRMRGREGDKTRCLDMKM